MHVMSNYSKGVVIALGPEDGESFWQPLPSTGYVINKINPYNSPYDAISIGLQILEPGAHIRRHAHERSHELLFCYRGDGYAEIEGRHYDIAEETMILIGRGLQHKVMNTGTAQMRLLWSIAPAGLEDWFRAIGRPRRAGDPLPAPFERPANVEAIQSQQRFIRPDKE
jgi:mannose-6-phosphate isomerase-like protein (cupin superfamily)